MDEVLAWFARNPVWGLLGTAASVLGLPLSYSLYRRSLREPSIRYRVERRIPVASDEHDLEISYKGQPVSGKVWAISVVLWNEGRLAIRPSHVLSPLMLEAVGEGARVLDARLAGQTRDVVGFKVGGGGQWALGRIPLEFAVLEHRDGARVDVVFIGPPGQSFRVAGVIEGQRELLSPVLNPGQAEIRMSVLGWVVPMAAGVVFVLARELAGSAGMAVAALAIAFGLPALRRSVEARWRLERPPI